MVLRVLNNKLLFNKKLILGLVVLCSLAASFQSIMLSRNSDGNLDNTYTEYNNYVIFKNSFHHLRNNQDLYIAHPQEHWDLFKYTPTFAFFFGVFSILPDWAGLTLWNLFNALVLFFAIYYLPRISDTKKGWVVLILSLELIGSMMNEQSNALVAGLLVFSFGFLENKKLWISSLCVVSSVFIKLFGVVGFALFLLYPHRWRMILYSFIWTIALFLVPLIIIDHGQYINLIKSYIILLMDDTMISNGYSVMGWLNSWFSLSVDNYLVVLVGAGIFLIPLMKTKSYNIFTFRYLMLCSILIWIVIFNHKAESATYVIAMTGVALWFVISEKNLIDISLLVCCIVLVSLSHTDIVPKSFRVQIITPYALKALPCIMIWIKITIDLIKLKSTGITQNYTVMSDS